MLNHEDHDCRERGLKGNCGQGHTLKKTSQLMEGNENDCL